MPNVVDRHALHFDGCSSGKLLAVFGFDD